MQPASQPTPFPFSADPFFALSLLSYPTARHDMHSGPKGQGKRAGGRAAAAANCGKRGQAVRAVEKKMHDVCKTGLKRESQTQATTYLPELLAGILAADALEDLGAARVLVDERRQAVHGPVDDDVQPVLDRVVRGHVLGAERL